MSQLTPEQLASIMDAYKITSTEDIHHAVKDIMKGVLQQTLEAELDVSLGYRKYDRSQKDTDNSRNGSYKKHVKSSFGPIDLAIPRDHQGEHEPIIVKKGQSDVSNLQERVISMYGKGMSNRDIYQHMHEIYGVEISADMVSKITDRLLPEIKAWQSRLLQSVYPILYMDAIHFNVRDNGKVVKKAVYLALGIDCTGMKDVLGIWIGENENSKYWLSVLTELKNRGVQDILIACVDGLSGFSEAIETVFPLAEVQRCIVHHIRYCSKFVNHTDRKLFCKDMKQIYQATTEQSALEGLRTFDKKWGKKYGYAVRSWENNWAQLSTFFKYPNEIRRIIYTTNPIESLNSSIRKITTPKRVFPTDDAVLKSVFLAVNSRIEKWTSRTRDWGVIWGQISIHFQDRVKEVTMF
ncbi:IS256 family transposase [Candidatus Marinamargulisbacteria bacterium]|nr:IS256 family transposase [Candidatus Marinamargulisbacteria bacterium]